MAGIIYYTILYLLYLILLHLVPHIKDYIAGFTDRHESISLSNNLLHYSNKKMKCFKVSELQIKYRII